MLMMYFLKDFEVEQDEMSRANPPVHLTRELWVCSPFLLLSILLVKDVGSLTDRSFFNFAVC